MTRKEVVERVVSCLSDDLLKSRWKGRTNPLFGHCYVVSEALFHLVGGSQAGWVATVARRKSSTHWWLENQVTGEILDATEGQFGKPYPHHLGRRTGFLTREPSRRARILMSRAFPHGLINEDSTTNSTPRPAIPWWVEMGSE